MAALPSGVYVSSRPVWVREDGGARTRREGPRLAAAPRSCEERLAFLGFHSRVPPPLRCFPPKGVFPQRGLEERTRWGARGRCVHWGEDEYRGEGAVPPPPSSTRTPGSSGMAGFRDGKVVSN